MTRVEQCHYRHGEEMMADWCLQLRAAGFDVDEAHDAALHIVQCDPVLIHGEVAA